MSHCQITFIANTGVSLQLGQHRIWSDALHDRRVVGFSTVTPQLWNVLQAHPDFLCPEVLFYTHCHPDHYSRALTKQVVSLNPEAILVLPEQEFDKQVTLTGPDSRLTIGDLQMNFFKLTHEAPKYQEVPHYGCILESDGFRILITGDCAVADPKLATFIGDRQIDLALLNFPWVTLRKGRHFIEEILRPQNLLVYHLPFQRDDRWGYREAARKGAAQVKGVPNVRVLLEPFQRESII